MAGSIRCHPEECTSVSDLASTTESPTSRCLEPRRYALCHRPDSIEMESIDGEAAMISQDLEAVVLVVAVSIFPQRFPYPLPAVTD